MHESLDPRSASSPGVPSLPREEQRELNCALSNACVLRNISSPSPWAQHVVYQERCCVGKDRKALLGLLLIPVLCSISHL